MCSAYSFISQLRHAPFPQSQGCIAICCEYDASTYQDSLFDAFGIVFEPSLSRAVTKRKAEFLAGRICAYHALQQLGAMDCTVNIGVDRSPLFPSSYLGSISHTESSAICVVSTRRDCIALGIDIENWIGSSDASKIKNQILDLREQQLCANLPLQASHAYTLCFSAKESFFKAYYPHVGAYFGFSEATVTRVHFDGQDGHVELTPSAVISPSLPSSVHFNIQFVITSVGVVTFHRFSTTAE